MATNKNRLIKGFTIIGLVIVIVIIGVLVTLTAVYYDGVQTKARDISTLSDIDQMDALQTSYGISHNVSGKAYYSGNGPDSELGYTPTEGTIIDVVIDDDDYCIRAYNPNGTKNTILNASEKESTAGKCATLAASSAALSTVAPGLIPDVTLALVGDDITADVSAVTCQGGITQYQISSRIDDGAWVVSSDWSSNMSHVQAVSDNVKYDYQAQARCYTSETIQSSPVLGAASSYTYNDDHMPIATSVSGYWSEAPDGYLLEDGSAVSRTTYADLYAALGGVASPYGQGDGVTTFNLPDSRGRVAVNKNSSDAEFATMGQKYGEKTHLLTGAETGTTTHSHTASSGVDSPNHTHSYTSETTAGGTSTWYAHFDNQSYHYFHHYENINSGGATARHTHPITVNNSSATNATSTHNNIQPSIVKVSAIKYINLATTSSLPTATSVEGYFTTTPVGYLPEDGSAVSCITYADLYTALNGGTCSGTFLLPDSRGRAAVNKSSIDTEFDTISEKNGNKSVTLTGVQSGTSVHNHSASSGNDSPDHAHNYASESCSGGCPQYYAHTNTQGSHYFYTYTGAGSGGVSTSHTHSITVNNSTAANATSAHNEIQPSIVKNFVIKYTPASGSTDYTAKGTSISGYFSTTPTGYLLEDGAAVSCTTYADLYTVLNGGTCSGTFNLPDSRGRLTVNKSPTDTEFDTIGEIFLPSEKSVTLKGTESGTSVHNHPATSGNDSPDHTHTYLKEVSTGGPPWYSHSNVSGSHVFYTYGTMNMGGASTRHTHSIAINNTSAVDASSSHNNIQPSIVQMFAIKY